MTRLIDDRPDWTLEGRDWPNRAASRFVEAGGLGWHVQVLGEPDRPALLLVHGLGAATHSWRALAPLLAEHFRVVAPDLPGHGFSGPLPAGSASLPGVAEALADLLRALDIVPSIAAGHAAGAAVIARLCLDHAIDPALFLAFNGALTSAPGFADRTAAKLTRPILLHRVTPRLLAWFARRAAVQRVFDAGTPRIDAAGRDLYKRLLAKSGHVAGTLRLMADWDLAALASDLPRLKPRTILVAGSEDRAVLPRGAFALRERLPDARVEMLEGLGHLAHEEAPERMAALVLREARQARLLPADADGA